MALYTGKIHPKSVSEGVARAKISENFRKFRAVGGLRDSPIPQIGLSEKTPDLAVLCPGLTILKF